MGCDIHSIAERFVDGAWRPISLAEARQAGLEVDPRRLQYASTESEKAETDWSPHSAMDLPVQSWEPFDSRSYLFFDWLCGVRGPREELKSRLSEKPRGLPDDLSPISKMLVDAWDSDGHSHSFATLAEFRAAAASGESAYVEGHSVVPFQLWAKWVLAGRPKVTGIFAARPWPPGAYWHDDKNALTDAAALAALAPIEPSNEKAFSSAAALFKPGGGNPTVSGIEYDEPILDTFQELREAMRVLEAVDPDPTKTRVVFFFDN